MNPERQLGGPEQAEIASGGGSPAEPSDFWIPVYDARSDRYVPAAISEKPSPLSVSVERAVAEPSGAGSRLAEIILDQGNQIVRGGDSMDAWGGARLQIALEQSIQTYRGSIDDLARAAQQKIVGQAGPVQGMERLADLVKGARSTSEYIRGNPLNPGSRRYSSLELDVLAKVDAVEIDFGSDGKFNEVRLVQVKSSPDTLKKEAESIVGAHRRLLGSYVPGLAQVFAAAEATAESAGEQEPEKRFAALVAASGSPEQLATALQQNPQAHLALRMGKDAPKLAQHLSSLYTRAVAEKLFAAALAAPVAAFRVLKIDRNSSRSSIAASVRSGSTGTKFFSVLAAGSRVMARVEITADFSSSAARHPAV
jgi:hypothetical protein